MFIWDEQILSVADPLCSLRAYFYHLTIAWIHHSLCFVLTQWLFDSIFVLPLFLTNNMKKLSIGNLCFISLDKFPLVFYLATISFLLSDIITNIIYRLLVRYVREVSSRTDGNDRLKMQRDLTIVRRIVILNIQLIIIGFPVLIFAILIAIRTDLLPQKY
ncbi:unnamed protein product, partial [Adineta ricciae]